MLNMKEMVGEYDILFITLDTLRYDVAQSALDRGLTPRLRKYLPEGRWELRDSPGNFTWAAHHAFFAGFLPTKKAIARDSRLFAAEFPGSETTGEKTFTFKEPDLVSALAARRYHTVCIGGVGFFNKLSALGSVFPALFHESYWSPEMGVTSPNSTQKQVERAVACLKKLSPEKRLFLFVNVSALHQPNCIFTREQKEDDIESQICALAYVDQHLPDIIDSMSQRAPLVTIICSDHGTAYGENGLWGHRTNHPVVWDVPYAEFILNNRKANK